MYSLWCLSSKFINIYLETRPSTVLYNACNRQNDALLLSRDNVQTQFLDVKVYFS